jgi:hypothetical protein
LWLSTLTKEVGVAHTKDARPGVPQRLSREMKRFVVIFVYLGLLIGAFNIYRWLIMAEYHVGYFVYGYTLIEALVLAKVIIVGESLGIGERFAHRPLIFPTLYKTLLFALCVLVVAILEYLVTGFLHGQGLAAIFHEVVRERYELLGRILIMFVALLPFFAFRETMRALGEVRLFDLFFRQRDVASGPSTGPWPSTPD